MTAKLTLLGTGSFFITKDRSSSSYLLEADGKKILIDCGPGTLMRLSQAGVDLSMIDYVFLTHLHADHTSDLFPMYMNYRLRDFALGGKIENLPMFIGPKGIAEFVLTLSRTHQLLAVEGWDKIKMINIESQHKLGNLIVDSFHAKHTTFGIEIDSYAYRFLIDGGVIAFSGDSVKCEGVEKACRDADVFVCDASYAKGNGNPAHMDTHDVGLIAESSNVKKVILSHLYPETDNVDVVAEVKEKYSGEVVRGADLMTIEL